MESKQEIRNSLGIAYRGLEAHIDEVKKRKEEIASLETELKTDIEAIKQIRLKVEELEKELNKII